MLNVTSAYGLEHENLRHWETPFGETPAASRAQATPLKQVPEITEVASLCQPPCPVVNLNIPFFHAPRTHAQFRECKA